MAPNPAATAETKTILRVVAVGPVRRTSVSERLAVICTAAPSRPTEAPTMWDVTLAP